MDDNPYSAPQTEHKRPLGRVPTNAPRRAAAIGAFAALIGMVLAGEGAGDGLRARGWPVAAGLVQVLSPIKNFEPFGKGMLDSYAATCSILLIAVFLTLAVRQLDAQRLRG